MQPGNAVVLARQSTNGLPARKTHVFAIFHGATQTFVQSAAPIAAVALISRGVSLDALRTVGIILGIMVPVAVAVGWVTWSTIEYSVTGNALEMTSGLIAKKRVSVPISRIEAVDESQGPLARAVGVRTVKVQSAGGGKDAEITLAALNATAIDDLRAALGLAVAPPRDAPDWQLGWGSLIAGALTWGRIGLLAPVLAALGNSIDDIAPRSLDTNVPDDPAVVAIVAAGVLGGLWLVSIAAAIVSFAGFRVWRDPQRLRIERGAFQRRSASIAVDRIAGVRLVEGILRQPFGLAMLRVEVAGFADDQADTQVLCPVIRRKDAARIVGRLLPEVGGSFERPGARTGGSFVLAAAGPVALTVAAGACSTLAFGAAGALAWALVPIGILLAIGRSRAAGLELVADRLTLRFRRLARTTLIMRVRMVQHLQCAASVPQRRLGRASLIVGAGSGRRFRVHDLSDDGIQSVVASVARQMTRSPHDPMSRSC